MAEKWYSQSKVDQLLAALDQKIEEVSQNGTSVLSIAGTVPTSADLPATPTEGAGYVTQDTKHLWVWNGTEWIDLGTVQGPAGSDATVTDATVAPALAGAQSSAYLASLIQSRDAINVRDYNPPAGTADAAAALNAAATAARAAGKPLVIPFGTYYIDSTVNFRNLDVYCEGSIIVRHTTSVGVIVGDESQQRRGRRVELREVKHAGTTYGMTTWAHPALRIIGLISGEVRVGFCSLMELWADNTVLDDDSVAYCNFYLGRVNHLRLWAQGTFGWVNENNFYGGSYNLITFDGPSPQQPDHNVFHKPSVEGGAALVNVARGTNNIIHDARTEAGTSVSFGATTFHNVIEASFVETSTVLDAQWGTVTDAGRHNIVTTRQAGELTEHTLLRVDRYTPLFGQKGPYPAVAYPVPSVGGGRLATRAVNSSHLDITIPLEDPFDTTLAAGYMGRTPSRIDRLNLSSDVRWLVGSVYGYDAAGAVIDPTVTPFLGVYAGELEAWAGRYVFPNNVSTVTLQVMDAAVKSIRINLTPSEAAGTMFTHMTLTGFLKRGQSRRVVEAIRRAIDRPLPFVTTAPTEGTGPTGVRAGKYVIQTSTNKTLTAAAASGATLISTQAGFLANGDTVGVRLDDGRTHWSTVASFTSGDITLAAALPSAAASGNAVETVRWAAI